jgi:hypothetical protein
VVGGVAGYATGPTVARETGLSQRRPARRASARRARARAAM